MRRIELGTVLQQAHRAVRFQLVFQRPIGQPIGKDQRANLAQFDVPFGLGQVLGPPADLIGNDEQRVAVVLVEQDGRLDANQGLGFARRSLFLGEDVEATLLAQAQRRIAIGCVRSCGRRTGSGQIVRRRRMRQRQAGKQAANE